MWAGLLRRIHRNFWRISFFDELLEKTKQIYDFVLIDTPPIGTMIDAAVAAQKSDGAVLVIESEAVSYRAAQKAKTQIERTGCNTGSSIDKDKYKEGQIFILPIIARKNRF